MSESESEVLPLHYEPMAKIAVHRARMRLAGRDGSRNGGSGAHGMHLLFSILKR